MTDTAKQTLTLTAEPGSLPEAPLAMPAQVLERTGGWLGALVRPRAAQTAKSGH